MDKRDFRCLQLAQLEIMDEIHRICIKEKINYSLAYGSVIGAVRHKGFIPWDFDIDCMMLRADYDRFKLACINNLQSRFSYYDYTNVNNYNRPHAIVAINGTKLVMKNDKYNRNSFNPGIYVDIFPLDLVSSSNADRTAQLDMINKIKRRIHIKKRYNYCGSPFYKFAKWVRSLSQCWWTLNQLNEQLDVLMKQYSGCEQKYICSLAATTDKGDRSFPLMWYGRPFLMVFEDREFYVLQYPHNYLKMIYGDYLRLPPEEEREKNFCIFESVLFDRQYG